MAVGRPRGTRNGERIGSPGLHACLQLVPQLQQEGDAGGRAPAKERIAEVEGFPDRPSTSHRRWMLALTEADLCKRETLSAAGEHVEGLRKVDDYKRFKPEWAPSVSALYRTFSSFTEALAAAGLLSV